MHLWYELMACLDPDVKWSAAIWKKRMKGKSTLNFARRRLGQPIGERNKAGKEKGRERKTTPKNEEQKSRSTDRMQTYFRYATGIVRIHVKISNL